MSAAKIIYIESHSLSFLQSTIKMQGIDLSVVQRMDAEKTLPPGWVIKFSVARRRPAMKGRKFYIDCQSPDRDKSYDAFIKICQELLKGEYTPAGAAHLLLIAYAIGFMPDEIRIKGFNKIAASIDESKYETMVWEFINEYNLYFDEKKSGAQNKPSFEFFDEISFRLQYEQDYDHPVQILRWLLGIKRKSLPKLEMIEAIHAVPKMAIADFGFPVNTDESSFIDYLQKNPSQIPLWGHCFIDTYGKNYPFIKRAAIRIFINDWNNTGKFIFRKIYQNLHFARFEQGNKKLVPGLFTRYIHDQFFVAGITNKILQDIAFKSDLTVIGAWFTTLTPGRKRSQLNNSSINQLAQIFSRHLKEMADNMAKYVSGRNDSYMMWLNNIESPATQNAIALLTFSVIAAEDKLWDEIMQHFKKLCHQIKLYMYGAFTASDMAVKFANHLLCVILQLPKIKRVDTNSINRVHILSGLFSTILGYQWVTISEREKMIWDAADWRPNHLHIPSELGFIIKRLKTLNKMQQKAVSHIYNAISLYSTVPWPIA